MAWESIADFNSNSGVITNPNPGTPIQVLVPSAALKNRQVHSVLLQVLPKNAGKVAIGRTSNVRSGGVGNNPSGSVMACLPPPTANLFQSVSAGVPPSPASIDLINIWFDVDVANDGLIISFVDM